MFCFWPNWYASANAERLARHYQRQAELAKKENSAMSTFVQCTRHKSVTWRVLSTREEDNSAGYWTSSYTDKFDALRQASDLRDRHARGVRTYEVTILSDVGDTSDYYKRVSETWEAIS